MAGLQTGSRCEHPAGAGALRRTGWREEDLPRIRKGDKVKVRLAKRLRRETTMSLKWIARRLHIGQLALRFQPVA